MWMSVDVKHIPAMAVVGQPAGPARRSGAAARRRIVRPASVPQQVLRVSLWKIDYCRVYNGKYKVYGVWSTVLMWKGQGQSVLGRWSVDSTTSNQISLQLSLGGASVSRLPSSIQRPTSGLRIRFDAKQLRDLGW